MIHFTPKHMYHLQRRFTYGWAYVQIVGFRMGHADTDTGKRNAVIPDR